MIMIGSNDFIMMGVHVSIIHVSKRPL